MANKISDETMEYVGILAKLELSREEKEAAKADMEKILLSCFVTLQEVLSVLICLPSLWN